ncbi:hypothetical protein J7E97_23650 [Streptomyces sp. ISL-66]|uniref:hypothetical protein n=1 Tax=Streptomyces sp. ISL-66 TaxID=2819186 RepID=UPI001BE80AC5|nr:hypothetical protein [Streptomyces sp. ISL-66]MBT2470778.1 hypothetical protein [Streptomyces sp. ISL-66]
MTALADPHNTITVRARPVLLDPEIPYLGISDRLSRRAWSTSHAQCEFLRRKSQANRAPEP